MAGRFGRQHRDRQRRETKSQLAEVLASALYVKPDTGCETFTQKVELEDPDFRYTQRLVRHDSKLVEFALLLHRFQGGRWVEVYSVDSQHGYLHDHPSGHAKDDRRDIQPLHTQVDVQESLDSADRLVLEKYRRMRN